MRERFKRIYLERRNRKKHKKYFFGIHPPSSFHLQGALNEGYSNQLIRVEGSQGEAIVSEIVLHFEERWK